MKRTGRQKDIVTPEKKQEQRELLRLFSANIRKILKNTDLLADDLQEIRLRTGAPLLVVAKDQEYFLTPDGALTGEWEKGYPVSPTDIRDTMDYIGSFSLYAYEDELRQGFLTVEGGHRIGIAGKTVIEGEKVLRGPSDAVPLGRRPFPAHSDCLRTRLRQNDDAARYHPPDFGRGVAVSGADRRCGR